MKKKSSRRAMTLVELLIVVSLFTMISIVIYSSLANGLRVWEKSRRLVIEEDIAVFFDKITQDIRNSYVYSKIHFAGNERRISFPAIVTFLTSVRKSSPKEEYSDQMGKVTYYFDMSEKMIYRSQADYGQALQGEPFSASVQVMARNIESVEFQYVYLAENEKIISREMLEVLPSSIVIEVAFLANGQRRTMIKFIDVPLAG